MPSAKPGSSPGRCWSTMSHFRVLAGLRIPGSSAKPGLKPVEDLLADEGGDVGTGGARLHVGGDGDDGLLGRADEAELAVAARHAVRVAVGLAPDAKAVAFGHAEALGVVRVPGGDALPGQARAVLR